VVIDGAGDVFTATQSGFGSSIMEYTPAGVSSVFFSPSQFFMNTSSLGMDGAGDVFANSDRSIYKFAPDGSSSLFATIAGGQVYSMVADHAGDVFIGDLFFTPDGVTSVIDKYAPDGSQTALATMASGELPGALAYDDASGTLYIGEVGGDNNCCDQVIYSLGQNGSLNTFASNLFLPVGMTVLDSSLGSDAPEPGTWALAAAGTAAVLLRRFRR
jgi:hypothetical protein